MKDVLQEIEKSFSNGLDMEDPLGPKFYYERKSRKGEVVETKIDHKKFIELLAALGIRRFDIGEKFTFILIKDQIIEEITITNIQEMILNYITNLPEILHDGVTQDDLLQKFYTSPQTYFSEKKLSLLPAGNKLKFNQDTKEECFIYFSNGFVKCTPADYQLHEYKDLNDCIGKEQIIKRNFSYIQQHDRDPEKMGTFARFCYNIAFKKVKRFESLCSIIGYALHGYYETKLKAINFTDSNISQVADGRTGKTLVARGLGKLKSYCEIPGKHFDPENQFRYQTAKLDTQIVHINDAKKDLPFESLFNDITEGVPIERKNLQPFTINAKMIISSNKTLNIEGGSARDRIIEFEFSDHYSEKYSPVDEFGKWFFTKDWDDHEWNEFFNFMLLCISYYLKNGIVEVPPVNLNKRKLVDRTCSEFVEFMNEHFSKGTYQLNFPIEKHKIHDHFLAEYPDFREHKFIKQLRNFTTYLKYYARMTEGIKNEVTEGKNDSERYITFLPE